MAGCRLHRNINLQNKNKRKATDIKMYASYIIYPFKNADEPHRIGNFEKWVMYQFRHVRSWPWFILMY